MSGLALAQRPEPWGIAESLPHWDEAVNDPHVSLNLDTFDLRPSGIDIGQHLSQELLRDKYLQFHDGLQKHGLGLSDALFQSNRARHLEGHLGGVNFVIATVPQSHPQIHQGIVSHNPSLQRLLHPCFNRWNVFPGNRPRLNLAGEGETTAPLTGFQFNYHMAVLASSSELLYELAFGPCRFGYRLPVRHFRSSKLG